MLIFFWGTDLAIESVVTLACNNGWLGQFEKNTCNIENYFANILALALKLPNRCYVSCSLTLSIALFSFFLSFLMTVNASSYYSYRLARCLAALLSCLLFFIHTRFQPTLTQKPENQWTISLIFRFDSTTYNKRFIAHSFVVFYNKK